MVYADSLTPVAADGFLFTRNTAYPNVLEDFENSFNKLSMLPCDILLTPHPEASDLWTRLSGTITALGPTPSSTRRRAAVSWPRPGSGSRRAWWLSEEVSVQSTEHPLDLTSMQFATIRVTDSPGQIAP